MNKTFLFISCTVIDAEPKKQVSLKLLFLNFLVSQQESNKEMRPLKRRGRLTAHKVPNFIRHSDTELIILLVKGKTLNLKFTPNEDGCN